MISNKEEIKNVIILTTQRTGMNYWLHIIFHSEQIMVFGYVKCVGERGGNNEAVEKADVSSLIS